MKLLSAYFVSIIYLLISINAYAGAPGWLSHDPGMEKKVGGQWKKVEWNKNKAALGPIIDKCLCRFVVPFVLPTGLTIVPSKDDMELTKERSNRGVTIAAVVKEGGLRNI